MDETEKLKLTRAHHTGNYSWNYEKESKPSLYKTNA